MCGTNLAHSNSAQLDLHRVITLTLCLRASKMERLMGLEPTTFSLGS